MNKGSIGFITNCQEEVQDDSNEHHTLLPTSGKHSHPPKNVLTNSNSNSNSNLNSNHSTKYETQESDAFNRSNKSTSNDTQITASISNLPNNQHQESHKYHHQNPTPQSNNSNRSKNKSTKRKREGDMDLSQQHDLRTYEGLTFKLSNTTGVHAVETKTLQFSTSTLTSSNEEVIEGRDETLRQVEKLESQTTSNKQHHSQKNLKFQFFGVKKHVRNQNSEEKVRILESSYTQSPFPTSFERKRLATELGIEQRKVQIWFQNRRAKEKNPRKTPSPTFNSGSIIPQTDSTLTSTPLDNISRDLNVYDNDNIHVKSNDIENVEHALYREDFDATSPGSSVVHVISNNNSSSSSNNNNNDNDNNDNMNNKEPGNNFERRTSISVSSLLSDSD